MDAFESKKKSGVMRFWGRGTWIDDPEWEIVEAHLLSRHQNDELGGLEARILAANPDGSTSIISSLSIMADEGYFLVMYTDDFDGDHCCISPHNPDPNDAGEVELGGIIGIKGACEKILVFCVPFLRSTSLIERSHLSCFFQRVDSIDRKSCAITRQFPGDPQTRR
ncbi:MAG: hypothetical protein IPK50_07825 [Fibrobacterota bacterium]|nr:MAG: hypothetical protein IPK50_07825 [Fibrobacterota bacterium]